jgi:hypothetical protein
MALGVLVPVWPQPEQNVGDCGVTCSSSISIRRFKLVWYTFRVFVPVLTQPEQYVRNGGVTCSSSSSSSGVSSSSSSRSAQLR